MHNLRKPLITGIVMIALFSFVSVYARGTSESVLEVSFLDVGQGDATFIESPDGTQVLIDGGKGSSVLRELSDVMGYLDRDIDMIVATHPDLDHIGGLIEVLDEYTVHTILMTENMSDTPAFIAFLKNVRDEGANVLYARKGQVFELGKGPSGTINLSILFPDHDPTGLESNTSSIIARLTYGENEFLLTGDSPQQIEEYIVETNGSMLPSDVLRVGHHGSRTSTAESFLSAVTPKYAVLSVGAENQYGHPHEEVLARLALRGVRVLRTDTEGRITFLSNGVTLKTKTEK